MTLSLLLIFAFFVNSESKKFVKTYDFKHLTTDKWLYTTKFAVYKGTGQSKFRARIKNFPENTDVTSLQIDLLTYWDENWELVKEEQDCINKRILSRSNKRVEVPTNGEWSQTYKTSLSQRARQKLWYFAVADCAGLLNQHVTDRGPFLEVEYIITNVDGSHFSSEDGKLHLIYLVQIIVTLGFIGFGVYRLQNKNDESFEYEQVYTLLLCSLAADAISEIFLFLHYMIYSSTGEGSTVLSLFGLITTQIAQFLVTSTLLLVAHGWTIKYQEFKNQDIIFPIGALVLILQLLMVAITKVADNEHNKYHDYHGVSGFVLVLIRLVLWGLFIYFSKNSFQQKGEASTFHFRLFLIGSLYFLAFPILLGICQFIVVPYYRHRIMTIAHILIQHSTILVLSYLFTAKKSLYRKVNTRGAMII